MIQKRPVSERMLLRKLADILSEEKWITPDEKACILKLLREQGRRCTGR